MRPTRTRYTVVAFMVTLAMVTYLDRACIGAMAHLIRADLKLSIDQMRHVFSAFALAYAFFEIPTAWWADRRDTRSILAHIAIWRSVFTMATAGAFYFARWSSDVSCSARVSPLSISVTSMPSPNASESMVRSSTPPNPAPSTTVRIA